MVTGPAREVNHLVSWVFKEGFGAVLTQSAASYYDYGDLDTMAYGLVSQDQEAAIFAGAVVLNVGDHTAVLSRLATHAGFRKQGLGRRILGAVEQDLIARGSSQLSLSADPSASGFYQKLHYTHDGTDGDAVYFYKQLQHPAS